MSEIDKSIPYGFARDMTLRDWFAGMALQGLLAASEIFETDDSTYEEAAAKAAYKQADAMLKARGGT